MNSGFRGGVCRQPEQDHMFQNGEGARLGTSVERQGYDAKFGEQADKVFVDVVPGIA